MWITSVGSKTRRFLKNNTEDNDLQEFNPKFVQNIAIQPQLQRWMSPFTNFLDIFPEVLYSCAVVISITILGLWKILCIGESKGGARNVHPSLQFLWKRELVVTYYMTKNQWRIQDFPEGDAPTPKSAIILHIFCRKLHENERIWTPTGDMRPWHPSLRSVNVMFSKNFFENRRYWAERGHACPCVPTLNLSMVASISLTKTRCILHPSTRLSQFNLFFLRKISKIHMLIFPWRFLDPPLHGYTHCLVD